jgi:hypothetical protein
MCHGEADTNFELVRLWLNGCTQDELRTLRSIINGKIGKREITPEQQAKMQAARNQAAQRVAALESAIIKTLNENGHLADGDVCTLIDLKRAMPSWELE